MKKHVPLIVTLAVTAIILIIFVKPYVMPTRIYTTKDIAISECGNQICEVGEAKSCEEDCKEHKTVCNRECNPSGERLNPIQAIDYAACMPTCECSGEGKRMKSFLENHSSCSFSWDCAVARRGAAIQKEFAEEFNTMATAFSNCDIIVSVQGSTTTRRAVCDEGKCKTIIKY